MYLISLFSTSDLKDPRRIHKDLEQIYNLYELRRRKIIYSTPLRNEKVRSC